MPKTKVEKSIRSSSPLFISLKFKFIAALIVLVGVVLGLSGWWNLELHRGHMLQATEEKVRAGGARCGDSATISARAAPFRERRADAVLRRPHGASRRAARFTHSET